MAILTSYSIESFREIPFNVPANSLQNVGGVYGDQSAYTSWTLSDTDDHASILRSIVLYGNLHKVEIDTGNITRDDFDQLTLGDYESYILQSIWSVNGYLYDGRDTRPQGLTARGGGFIGGTTGGPSTGGPTTGGPPTGGRKVGVPGRDYNGIIEFLNWAKEPVGWVELNRSKPSLYYEACPRGQLAKVAYFYDLDQTIISTGTFNLDIEIPSNLTANDVLQDVSVYEYTNRDPDGVFDPSQRGFAVDEILNPNVAIGTLRYGLDVDTISWIPDMSGVGFAGGLNRQDNESSFFSSFLDLETTPVLSGTLNPNSPNFNYRFGSPFYPGAINTGPRSYLESLLSRGTIDALVGDLISSQNLDNLRVEFVSVQTTGTPILTPTTSTLILSPQEFAPVELLLSEREVHFNNTETVPYIVAASFSEGTLLPAFYIGKSIWGSPFETIRRALRSSNFPYTSGPCRNSSVGNEEDRVVETETTPILDPFGLDIYNLDKEYVSVYNKYRFCPPRKILGKNPFIDRSAGSISIFNEPVDKNGIKKISVNNLEEILVSENLSIVKIGAFDPDKKLILIENPIPYGDFVVDVGEINNATVVNTEYQYASSSKVDAYGIAYDDGTINESFFLIGASEIFENKEIPIYKSIYDLGSFDAGLLNIQMSETSLNFFETLNGIRDISQPIYTSTVNPYGTYNVDILKVTASIDPNTGQSISEKTTILIQQNGSTADESELKTASKNILNIAGDDKEVSDIIGVTPSGFPIYASDTLSHSINKLKEQLTGIKEVYFRGSEVLEGVVATSGAPMRSGERTSTRDPNAYDEYIRTDKEIQYVNTGIFIDNTINVDTYTPGLSGNLYNINTHDFFRHYTDGVSASPELTNDEINKRKYDEFSSTKIEFIGNHKVDRTPSKEVEIPGSPFDPFRPYRNLSPIREILGGYVVRVPGFNTYHVDITSVNTLLISKFDAIGILKEIWSRTEEDPRDFRISETNNGLLFLKPIGQEGADTIFRITGNPIDRDTYYEIPVSWVNQPYNSKAEPRSAFKVTYSVKETRESPKRYIPPSSTDNTFGGWTFVGLYHRDGQWPLDHKFRSGLLESPNWSPSDGSVQTGAWIRVNQSRVRVYQHGFASSAYTTVGRYIHKIWLDTGNQRWLQQNPSGVGPNGELSPWLEQLINPLGLQLYGPLGGSSRPSVLGLVEDWEFDLIDLKNQLIEEAKDIKGAVLVITLRDNKENEFRRWRSLENVNANPVRPDIGYQVNRAGHLHETWVNSIEVVDNSQVMDDRRNYWVGFYPEPTSHTLGKFDPNEWYRAVFSRSIKSPKNRAGQTVGNYPGVDAFNKRTLCDLIYLTEEMLKMHRARLVSIKEYVDNRISYYGQIETIDPGSGRTVNEKNLKFERTLVYMNALKNIFNEFK